MIRKASKDLMTKKPAAPAAKLSDEERSELTIHEATIERGKKRSSKCGRPSARSLKSGYTGRPTRTSKTTFASGSRSAGLWSTSAWTRRAALMETPGAIEKNRIAFTTEGGSAANAVQLLSEVPAVLAIVAKKVAPDPETGLRHPTWKDTAEAVREHRGEPLSRNVVAAVRKEAAGRKAEDDRLIPALPTWPDEARRRKPWPSS